MLTLTASGIFLSTSIGVGSKELGIRAKQTRAGRWQYRDAETGKLFASGMEPAAFAKKFWFRDDFTETVD